MISPHRIKAPTGWVYCVTNTINGKKYVGRTTDTIYRRWDGHISEAAQHTERNSPLNADIRSSTEPGTFTIEALEVSPTDQLDEREKYWIEKLDCIHPKGYNKTTGGRMGTKFCAETIALNSKQRTGRKHSEVDKRKMREVHRKRVGIPISLRNLLSGEVKNFSSRGEAAEHIGTTGAHVNQAFFANYKTIRQIWEILR